MLILIQFGIKTRTTRRARGEFFCPECATREKFVHWHVVEFFYASIIRLWKVRDVGEYIECCWCKTHFPLHILSFSPDRAKERAIAKFNVCVRALLLLTVRTTMDQAHDVDAEDRQRMEDDLLDAVCKALVELTGVKINRPDARASMKKVEGRTITALATLRELNPILLPEQRHAIVTAMISVASTPNGRIYEAARQFIAEAAQSTELTLDQVVNPRSAMPPAGCS